MSSAWLPACSGDDPSAPLTDASSSDSAHATSDSGSSHVDSGSSHDGGINNRADTGTVTTQVLPYTTLRPIRATCKIQPPMLRPTLQRMADGHLESWIPAPCA